MFSCILKGLTWGTFTQLCAPINSKKLLNSKVFVCWVREKTCFCWKMANWKASFYLDGERQLARSDRSCRIRITQHYAVGTHPCKGYQVLVLVLGTNLTVTVSLPSNYETFISSFCEFPQAASYNTDCFSLPSAQPADSFLSFTQPPNPYSSQPSQQSPTLLLIS